MPTPKCLFDWLDFEEHSMFVKLFHDVSTHKLTSSKIKEFLEPKGPRDSNYFQIKKNLENIKFIKGHQLKTNKAIYGIIFMIKVIYHKPSNNAPEILIETHETTVNLKKNQMEYEAKKDNHL